MSEYRLGVGRTNLCGSLEKQVKLVALPRFEPTTAAENMRRLVSRFGLQIRDDTRASLAGASLAVFRGRGHYRSLPGYLGDVC
jgi:hypothetical protein